MFTTRGALDAARASALLGKRGFAGDGWGGIRSQNSENWMENMIDMKSAWDLNAKHITDSFQRVKGRLRFSPWDRGIAIAYSLSLSNIAFLYNESNLRHVHTMT